MFPGLFSNTSGEVLLLMNVGMFWLGVAGLLFLFDYVISAMRRSREYSSLSSHSSALSGFQHLVVSSNEGGTARTGQPDALASMMRPEVQSALSNSNGSQHSVQYDGVRSPGFRSQSGRSIASSSGLRHEQAYRSNGLRSVAGQNVPGFKKKRKKEKSA